MGECTSRALASLEVDWLNEFDVAFWLASFDADPKDFRDFLEKHDPKSFRIVTARYAEYCRVRKLLRRETKALLRDRSDAKVESNPAVAVRASSSSLCGASQHLHPRE